MIENVNETPMFVSGIGWCRAVADRPYYDDLSDDAKVTFRIDTLPPPTNYHTE